MNKISKKHPELVEYLSKHGMSNINDDDDLIEVLIRIIHLKDYHVSKGKYVNPDVLNALKEIRKGNFEPWKKLHKTAYKIRYRNRLMLNIFLFSMVQILEMVFLNEMGVNYLVAGSFTLLMVNVLLVFTLTNE